MEKNTAKTKKVCKYGLDRIWINGADGRVQLCGWTQVYLGNLAECSIEELWNGKLAEEFRQSLLDGSYRFCDRQGCRYLANNNMEFVEFNVPEYPRFCNLAYEQNCNYVCKFCRKEHFVPKENDQEKIKRIEKEVMKILPHLDTLGTNGQGELFCSPSIMNMLRGGELREDLEIWIETNGSLFNQKNWEKISNVGSHKLKVAVTVHSLVEDTYQFLSGTNLPIDNIINNLYFMKELREKNVINHFQIATVICERNFREMPQFVETCLREFHPDEIRLRFYIPYRVHDRATEWFYDIRNPFHPYYEEFIKVMKHPIFRNEKVWKWQGESISEQKENPYITEHENFLTLGKMVMLKNRHPHIMDLDVEVEKTALYGGGAGEAYVMLLNECGINIPVVFDSYAKEKDCGSYKVIRPSLEDVSNYDTIIVTQHTYFEEIKKKLSRLKYKGKIVCMKEFVDSLYKLCEENKI